MAVPPSAPGHSGTLRRGPSPGISPGPNFLSSSTSASPRTNLLHLVKYSFLGFSTVKTERLYTQHLDRERTRGSWLRQLWGFTLFVLALRSLKGQHAGVSFNHWNIFSLWPNLILDVAVAALMYLTWVKLVHVRRAMCGLIIVTRAFTFFLAARAIMILGDVASMGHLYGALLPDFKGSNKTAAGSIQPGDLASSIPASYMDTKVITWAWGAGISQAFSALLPNLISYSGIPIPMYKQVPVCLVFESAQFLVLLVSNAKNGTNVNALFHVSLRAAAAMAAGLATEVLRRKTFLKSLSASEDSDSPPQSYMENVEEMIAAGRLDLGYGPECSLSPSVQPDASWDSGLSRVQENTSPAARASLLRGLAAAEGDTTVPVCLGYRSRFKRLQVTLKAPGLELEDISTAHISAMETRLRQSLSAAHVMQFSVRPGCVIIELDLVLGLTGGSNQDPGEDQAGGTMTLQHFLRHAKIEDLTSRAFDGSDIIGIKVGDEGGVFRYNADSGSWSSGDSELAAEAPITSVKLSLQSRCMVLTPGLVAGLGAQITASMSTDPKAGERTCSSCPNDGRAGWSVEAVLHGKALPIRVVQVSTGHQGEFGVSAVLPMLPPDKDTSTSARQVACTGKQMTLRLDVDLCGAAPGLLKVHMWCGLQLVSTGLLLLLPAGLEDVALELAGLEISECLIHDLAFVMEAAEACRREGQAKGGRLSESAFQLPILMDMAECLSEWADMAELPILQASVHVWMQQLEATGPHEEVSGEWTVADGNAVPADEAEAVDILKPGLSLFWCVGDILVKLVFVAKMFPLYFSLGWLQCVHALLNWLLLPTFLVFLHVVQDSKFAGAGSARRFLTAVRRRTPSSWCKAVFWVLGPNVGVLLHLNRLHGLVTVMLGIAPEAVRAITFRAFNRLWLARLIWAVFESYDLRARVLVTVALEFPVCYSIAAYQLKMPNALLRTAASCAIGLAGQVAVMWCRSQGMRKQQVGVKAVGGVAAGAASSSSCFVVKDEDDGQDSTLLKAGKAGNQY